MTSPAGITKIALAMLFTFTLVSGCASTSIFHNQLVPEGSLRLGEVISTASKADISRNRLLHDTLATAVALPDAEIHDGNVVAVRVSCCRDENDPTQDILLFVYAPDGLTPARGDIVEIWSGMSATETDATRKMPNTVTQIRQKADAAQKLCRWEPDRPGLWARRLHCDWMSAEGWIQQGGLADFWVKPIAAPVPPRIARMSSN